jgi:hypothetical protein
MATPGITSEPAPQVSSIGRIFGVIFSPKPTFESIAQRPKWVLPLILVTLISLGMDSLLISKADWRAFAQEQLEKSGRLNNIPQEKVEQMVAGTALGQKYSYYVRGVVGDAILALFLASLYLAAFNLVAGASLKFKTALSIVAYTLVPLGIKEILGIIILLLKEPGTVNPLNIVASNAGAFVSSDAPTWLLSLGISIDIFTYWGMALAVIGFHAANPKKIKMGTAIGVVVGLYLFFVILGVGLAAAVA